MCSGGGRGLTDDNGGSDQERAITIFTGLLEERRVQVHTNMTFYKTKFLFRYDLHDNLQC